MQLPSLPPTIEESHFAAEHRLAALENKMKNGIGWFFVIACLSLLNSIIFFMGGSLSFVVGLAITQVVDGFASAFIEQGSGGLIPIIRGVALSLNLVIAALFAGFGILGRKRMKIPVIIGMVLYGLDTLLMLALGVLIGVIFHIVGIAGLWGGIRAMMELDKADQFQAVGDFAAIQSLGVPPPTDPATRRKRLLIFTGIVVGFFFLMLAPLLAAIFISQ